MEIDLLATPFIYFSSKKTVEPVKYRLLDILCCPDCGGPFQLDIYRADRRDISVPAAPAARCASRCGLADAPSSKTSPQDCIECYKTEISEGKLIRMECANKYPIIGGVPRVLPRSLLGESLAEYHRDFLDRYGDAFAESMRSSSRGRQQEVKDIARIQLSVGDFCQEF